MNYVKSHGQDLEKDYKYTAKTGSCHASSYTEHVKVTSVHEVSSKSSAALLSAIEKGPVSVTVDAEQNGFMHYTGGIVDEQHCSGTRLDHAIAAVGYGTENGQEYYIVRNSWGTR